MMPQERSSECLGGQSICILHFNDCYNIEPRAIEPAGGAARFKTALNSFKSCDPLTLFSGDILGPSIMSTFTKGEQMIPVLNGCGVECAVFGNHDFDYGLDNLITCTEKTHFPWLMSNVFDIETRRPLAEGKLWFLMEKNGKKIGIIGLVEEEWLATLATIEQHEVNYVDFVVQGKKLANQLKHNHGVDIVIALTHMRTPNDIRLAKNVPEIDLILGGHDHDYEVTLIEGRYIIKSGTDFRQFSKIDLHFDGSCTDSNGNHEWPQVNSDGSTPLTTPFRLEVQEIEVTSTAFIEDEQLVQQLDIYSQVIEGKMDLILGQFGCDLDGRFASIRTQETNLGNFVCDIMLASTAADLAILNSGTLRSDQIHKQGDFKLRDLVTIMPMMDAMIVLEATGDQILRALENGVSQWPKLEGRFPQVAGVKFAFDPMKPAKSRIHPDDVTIGDEPLDMNQSYRLCTKGYLAGGKDGYTSLKECKVLVDSEECPELCTSIQNHFEAVKMILHPESSPHHTHHQSVIAMSRRSSVMKAVDESVGTSPVTSSSLMLPMAGVRKLSITKDMGPIGEELVKVEHQQCLLRPHVQGRIIIIDDHNRHLYAHDAPHIEGIN